MKIYVEVKNGEHSLNLEPAILTRISSLQVQPVTVHSSSLLLVTSMIGYSPQILRSLLWKECMTQLELLMSNFFECSENF